ncbi:unnamed protein product [Larinioides sclopetarius]|uniref:Uncharacterized protein n=1 Tax=Larinioides sclopetarius TaxID=280406 RepID=A0AAV1YUU1_9ARAC
MNVVKKKENCLQESPISQSLHQKISSLCSSPHQRLYRNARD